MNGEPSPEHTGRGPQRICETRAKGLSMLRRRHLATLTIRWFKRPPDIRKIAWCCLLVTLGADGLVALTLAVIELNISTTPIALLGAGILSAIALANFVALNSVRQAAPSWARDAVIGQVVMLFLAIWIIIVDAFQSPQKNWLVLTITAIVGLLSLSWIFVLAGRAAVHWTKATAIATALFPLAASVQFWVQNYYIPDTSTPQVDILPELTVQDVTDSTIHLSAKVTVHNRGAAKVIVTDALMRITAYPSATQEQQTPPYACAVHGNPHWCVLEGGVDISGANHDADVRANDPTPATNAKPLYSGLFMGGPDSFLTPGETDTIQREVDVDKAQQFRLVRLSVSGVFLTERKIKDIKSCMGTNTSAFTDNTTFSHEVKMPEDYSDQDNIPPIDPRAHQHYLCMYYYFEPRNVIDWLTATAPGPANGVVLQVRMILNDPQRPGLEYPQTDYGYLLANRKGEVEVGASRKIDDAYPIGSYSDVSAEYAPTDQVLTKGNK
jgi:hypothetical protein